MNTRKTQLIAPVKTQNNSKKFDWKIKGKFNWKTLLILLITTLIIAFLENFGYFFIAILVGNQFSNQIGQGHDIQLIMPVDKMIPWFTPLFIIYIPWPAVWFLVLPIIIYYSSGKQSYWDYVVNSLLMYVAGILIYAIFPTTAYPKQFSDGTYDTLSTSAPFYNIIHKLGEDSRNVYGACPSYHNYWAILLIFFAFKRNIKWYWRYPMMALGLLVSLSTLMLHQHYLADVVITYSMALLFFWIIRIYNFGQRLEILCNKLFKTHREIKHQSIYIISSIICASILLVAVIYAILSLAEII